MNEWIPSVEDTLVDFGNFLEQELGYSTQTRKAYLYDLKQFFAYITSLEDQNNHPFETPLKTFQNFILELKKKFNQFP